MLVLSRQLDQRIWIGDDVRITIVRISPGVVRLGIDAPAGVAIVREELADGAQGAGDRAKGIGHREQPAEAGR